MDVVDQFFKKPRADLQTELRFGGDDVKSEDGDGDASGDDGELDAARAAVQEAEEGLKEDEREGGRGGAPRESEAAALGRLLRVLMWDTIHPDSRFRTAWCDPHGLGCQLRCSEGGGNDQGGRRRRGVMKLQLE